MADDEVDVEGEFDLKTELGGEFYDANELPSKSANLLPEFTSPAWMLEQGWSLDSCMDEKSKATIEKMLLEEQQYMYGRKTSRYLSIKKNVLLVSGGSSKTTPNKSPWTQEEKNTFVQGMGIFGRSWSKIAGLIPTRTSLQVKNYAQQYLKNLAKKRAEFERTESEASKDSPNKSQLQTLMPSLAASMKSVTTAQPTVPVASVSGVKNRSLATSCTATITPTKSENIQPSSTCSNKTTGVKDKAKKQKVVKKKSNQPEKGKVLKKSGKRGQGQTAGSSSASHSVVPNVGVSQATEELQNGAGAISLEKHQRQDMPGDVSSSMISTNVPVEGATSSSEQLQGVELNNSFTTTTAADKDNEEDEDLDIEVDIENDDDENPILQSRSASPSSVYKQLLESASIATAPGESDVKTDGDQLEMTPQEEIKEEGASLDGCSSTDGASKSEEAGGEMSRDMEEEEEEQYSVKSETVVNGVVSASGEIMEFDIPTEEKVIESSFISDEEKSVHADFFDGRVPKTPERYVKIRNYIIDCWLKSKPTYLNKTSIRGGLKNCGDVNCIGRIHLYLECIGAINFGCEQAAYRNPNRSVGGGPNSRVKVINKDLMSALTVKSDSARPRKRRIRDETGLWVDEKELEGKTIDHERKRAEAAKKVKTQRVPKPVYDPFKLVPCLPFSDELKAPYGIEVFSTALAVMDIHAHISKTEVIGMLGGKFCRDTNTLTVSMAVPCKSMSTGMQCEMDPVSQTLASEQIEDVGMQVVGWYHSHPTFCPNPSVRDIETQQKFQYWFSKGGNHFVGIIISPYNSVNQSVYSDIQCLTISDVHNKDFMCNTPYKFEYSVVYRENLREILGPASDLAEKYSNYVNRVMLSCQYRVSLGITCLTKMLQSVKRLLIPEERDTKRIENSSSSQTDTSSEASQSCGGTTGKNNRGVAQNLQSVSSTSISTACQAVNNNQSMTYHTGLSQQAGNPNAHFNLSFTNTDEVDSLLNSQHHALTISACTSLQSKVSHSAPLSINTNTTGSTMLPSSSTSSSSSVNKSKVEEVLHWLEQIFLDKFTHDTPRSPPIGSLSSLEQAKPRSPS